MRWTLLHPICSNDSFDIHCYHLDLRVFISWPFPNYLPHKSEELSAQQEVIAHRFGTSAPHNLFQGSYFLKGIILECISQIPESDCTRQICLHLKDSTHKMITVSSNRICGLILLELSITIKNMNSPI